MRYHHKIMEKVGTLAEIGNPLSDIRDIELKLKDTWTKINKQLAVERESRGKYLDNLADSITDDKNREQ